MSFLRAFFSSISAKFALISIAMGATTVAALLIGYLIVNNISALLYTLSEERVPSVRSNIELLVETEAVRNSLSGIIVAKESTVLDQHISGIANAIGRIQTIAENPHVNIDLDDLLNTIIATDLKGLGAARHQEIQYEAKILERMTVLQDLSTQIGSRLIEVSDDVNFSAAIAAEGSLETVNSALTQLIESDIANLRAILRLDANINLVTGALVSLSLNPDPGVASILEDLANGGMIKVDALATELIANEDMAVYADDINNITATLEKMIESGRYNKSVALSTRTDAAKIITSAIDDIEFSFTIRSEDTLDTTRNSIDALVNTHMKDLRENAAVDSAIRSLLVLTLEAAGANTPERLSDTALRLNDAASKLAAVAGTAEGMQIQIAELLTIARADDGIVFLRNRILDARKIKQAVLVTTQKHIGKLIAAAAASSGEALSGIEGSSTTLLNDVENARFAMLKIGAVSIALFLAVQVGGYIFLARPMGKLSSETQRLASGDLADISVRPGPGEIGRMATSLSVFRQTLMDKQRLEAEEREASAKWAAEIEQRAADDAQRARDEAERELAESKRKQEARMQRDREQQEREERERKILAEQQQARLELERNEQAKREQIRMQAEKEKAVEARRQQQVVADLAAGLQRLSVGDLGATIDTVFPDAYEPLRIDFNQTLVSLRRIVSDISSSANVINGSAGELGLTADGLSSSAESTAQTLETSATALNSLQGSVSETAKNSATAREAAADADESAKNAAQVVAQTVEAMGSIEDSSGKIGSITALIEDIAFQTNLLALNAGVEAARAGESGRGFAVVASEVRALAGRSTDAVAQINSLIRESETQVTRGVALVGKTGEALDEISRSVSDVTRRVNGIAERADVQARELNDINSAIGRLENAAQTNATTAQETAAAGHVLRDAAHNLSTAIQTFTCDENDATSDHRSSANLDQMAV